MCTRRHLYQLEIAIDANFKLKRKDRVSKAVDLADGKSYFVPTPEYIKHITENSDMTEVRST